MNSKKLHTIWSKLSVSTKFNEIINKYRKLLGIPPTGFANGKEYQKWTEKNNNSEYNKTMRSFFLEMEQIPLLSNRLREVIMYLDVYLLWGGANDDMADMTGCNLVVINPNKTATDPGLYINIGLFSNTQDIKEFIERQKCEIRSEQDKLRKEAGLINKPRIRNAEKFERDMQIYNLSRQSRESLIKLGGGKSKYKDIQIANIMKEKFGCDISNDNVRKIISRQKKIVEE